MSVYTPCQGIKLYLFTRARCNNHWCLFQSYCLCRCCLSCFFYKHFHIFLRYVCTTTSCSSILFFAVWMPKLAKTPVNTEAINVGSIFFVGSLGWPHSSKLKSLQTKSKYQVSQRLRRFPSALLCHEKILLISLEGLSF